MSARTVLACGTAAVAALLAAPGALANGGFSNLQPGVPSAGLSERVRVNVVFVGLKPGQINTQQFLAGLPQRSKPIVRSRLFYGVTEELGIDYSYDYATTFTSARVGRLVLLGAQGAREAGARGRRSRISTTTRPGRATSARTTSSTRRPSRSG